MYIIRYILGGCQVYNSLTFIKSSDTGKYTEQVIVSLLRETQPDD